MYTEEQLYAEIAAKSVGGLPKWPQMLVTGKSVTQEQAKEIIFRTDRFFTDPYEYSGGNAHEFNRAYRTTAGLGRLTVNHTRADGSTFTLPDYSLTNAVHEDLGILIQEYVNNDWGSSAFVFGPHGWCHPDGTIKYFDNVGKWPSIDAVYNEWVAIARAFPFLDLHVTLMSGESCEDDTHPVINFRVVNGDVTVENPDTTVHEDVVTDPRKDFVFETLLLSPDHRELGAPGPWYDEFAERVSVAVEKVIARSQAEYCPSEV